jgi:hypothetical protein
LKAQYSSSLTIIAKINGQRAEKKKIKNNNISVLVRNMTRAVEKMWLFSRCLG